MPDDKILAILTALHPEHDYAASRDFVEDGLLDSFDIVMLVAELESAFASAIPGDRIRAENFRDVGAIRRLVLGEQ